MKLRKLFFLLVSIALVAGFSSCSDDDDISIVGDWTYTQGNNEAVVETTNAEYTTLLKEYFLGHLIDSDHVFRCNADGTYEVIVKEGGENVVDYEGTYSFSNGKLKMDYDSNGEGGSTINVTLTQHSLSLEDDETARYNDRDKIEWMIREYGSESLKAVDPATISVTKAIGITKYTR